MFPSYGDGGKLRDGRAYFQHIGAVKVKLHRPTEGRIKTMAFKREADGWYVVCSCDLGDVAVAPSANPAVGIDLGLQAFLTTSEGGSVPPPKFYLIAAATTAAGLTVESYLDTDPYPAGQRVSDAQMATLQLQRDDFHGEWN